jgi:hypothetical protein
MPQRLTDLWIEEVSLCKRGMNEGARVALFKSTDRRSDMPKKTKKEGKPDLKKALSELGEIPDEVLGQLDELLALPARVAELEGEATKKDEAITAKDAELKKATDANAELEKKLKTKKDGDGEVPEAVQKTLDEQAAQIAKQDEALKNQGEALKKSTDTIEEMRKSNRRREHVEKAKSFTHVAIDSEKLADIFEKAEAAGVLDDIVARYA